MTAPTQDAPTGAEAMREAVAADYVLVKQGVYFRPNANGYTGVLDEAGRYTEAEAQAQTGHCDGVTAILASEAPRFSEACWQETQVKVLQADLAKVASEHARLTKERDEAIANAREPVGDLWDEIRRLEEECRICVRERNEWKAVADGDLARALAAEADAARRGEEVTRLRAALKLAENPLSYQHAQRQGEPGSKALAEALEAARAALATNETDDA